MSAFAGLAGRTSRFDLKRLPQGSCIAIVLAAVLAAQLRAADEFSEAAVTARRIAWGEPKDGLRLGLAPETIHLAPGDKHFTVDVWFENRGNAPLQVPLSSWGKMLVAAVPWKSSPPPDRLFYLADTCALKKNLRQRELQPGERLRLPCVVQLTNYMVPVKVNQFDVGPVGDPVPERPFRLCAGLLSAFENPSTEEHWQDPRLVRSGEIHVHWGDERSDDGEAETSAIDQPVVVYEGSSPNSAYDAQVIMHQGPSEQWSWWSLDINRNCQPVARDRYFRPFYAWTCVNHGRAMWLSDSVLHFHSYGAAQGRVVSTYVQNTTERMIPYAEVWVRSVDAKGYSHSPSIFLLFDLSPGERRLISPGPQVFAGGEYFLVGCEQESEQSAVSRFRIPAARDTVPYLPFARHRLTVRLARNGPAIEGSEGLAAITQQEADTLVTGTVQLPLTEDRRDHRQVPASAQENTAVTGRDDKLTEVVTDAEGQYAIALATPPQSKRRFVVCGDEGILLDIDDNQTPKGPEFVLTDRAETVPAPGTTHPVPESSPQ